MRFYLGTHEPSWQRKTNKPLFISHRRLKRLKNYKPATGPWCLDSGGFTELSHFGGWQTSPADYCKAIKRYQNEIGQMYWAAPQDHMCEPFITAKTGLSVKEHQLKTVQNFLELKNLAADLPFIPVLQGWRISDYLEIIEMYDRAGVNLQNQKAVGLGSVCRRQGTNEISELVETLAGYGLRLHGFGVKTSGLAQYGKYLASADSMAWSFYARRQKLKLDKCQHVGTTCANCLTWALEWREQILNKAGFNA